MFGIPLTEKSGDGWKDMSFTPYNGSDDKNPLSWTLGKAVLQAAVRAIRAPALAEEEG